MRPRTASPYPNSVTAQNIPHRDIGPGTGGQVAELGPMNRDSMLRRTISHLSGAFAGQEFREQRGHIHHGGIHAQAVQVGGNRVSGQKPCGRSPAPHCAERKALVTMQPTSEYHFRCSAPALR